MNERITELARQCASEDHLTIYNSNYARFAELIVKECIDIASKYDEPKMSGPGLMIGHMIEQHFGVEG